MNQLLPAPGSDSHAELRVQPICQLTVPHQSLRPQHRAVELADALLHLCKARVACKVHRTAANGMPPAAEASERHFKCLNMDVGLMCAALHLNLLDFGRDDLTLVNNGTVAEQFVGQHLLPSDPPYETPVLHYWGREVRNSVAEVDYAIAVGRHIVPVEIKAGLAANWT